MIIDLRKNVIFTLKQKLFNTDYKIHKYTEGVLTEEEFNLIKAERQAWRNEINRIEGLTDEAALTENLIIEVEDAVNVPTEEPEAEELTGEYDTEMAI